MEAQTTQEQQTMGQRLSALLTIASKLPDVKELVLVNLKEDDKRKLYIGLVDNVLYLDRRSMSVVKMIAGMAVGWGAKTLAFAAIGGLPVIGQLFIVCSLIVGIANSQLGKPIEVNEGETLLYPDSSDFGIIDEVNQSLWNTLVGYLVGRNVTKWFRNRRVENR